MCLRFLVQELLIHCQVFDQYIGLMLAQGHYEKALNFTDSICLLIDCDWHCNSRYIQIHVNLNEFSTAEQQIKKWEEQRGKQVFTNEIGYVYYKLGRIKEAEEGFQVILKRNTEILSNASKPPDVIFYYWQAQILAFQNRKNEALQFIKMIDERGFNFYLFDRMTNEPMFENLWDDPEFKAIVKQAQEEKAAIRAQIIEMEERGELDL